MQKKIDDFVKENSHLIFQYINEEILKNIGEMNYNYFEKIIQDTNITTKNIGEIPYFILTQLSQKTRLDYTTLRNETINFDQINKEASVYYNYVQFTLENDSLYLQLMQTKIGGMPIDKDIVKFTKRIPIKNAGLEEFIIQKEFVK